MSESRAMAAALQKNLPVQVALTVLLTHLGCVASHTDASGVNAQLSREESDSTSAAEADEQILRLFAGAN